MDAIECALDMAIPSGQVLGSQRGGPALKVAVVLVLMMQPFGCTNDLNRHQFREITARTFKAERIVDGDTFKVVYDGELTSVRMIGINAPERNDARGAAATAALAKLIAGKVVRLEFPGPRKRDNFGRLLCKVYVGDMDVGAKMIRQGHAVAYHPRR